MIHRGKRIREEDGWNFKMRVLDWHLCGECLGGGIEIFVGLTLRKDDWIHCQVINDKSESTFGTQGSMYDTQGSTYI